MSTLQSLRIETASAFKPLLQPARYKGARGGRGSGKSHFFAELLVEDCLAEPGNSGEGLRAICLREVQKDLMQSAKLLIEDKLAHYRLGEVDGFKIFREVIQTPGDGIIIFKGMQDYTAESVKSLERFKRAWWEEAQTATQHSLDLLRPTIRDEGSELWFSWNPRFEDDPVELLLGGEERPTGAIVVTANWRDNPWFPEVLNQERRDTMRLRPGQYRHIWEGDFVSIIEGAYYADCLEQAQQEGRISKVARDPLMAIRAFWDIGGTGKRADATAIWIAQFIGREIRVLDYYEAKGQPLGAHIAWLRKRGYEDAYCVLPHDGVHGEKVYDTNYENSLRRAGFEVETIPNQGTGAYALRVEAGRQLFPSIWFNEATTESGRKALGWYHEKIDEKRRVGVGADHDWSSHAADAFGLMCCCYEPPRSSAPLPDLDTSWVV